MPRIPIQGPQDLRRMPLGDLQNLADDIRQAILSACLKNGGHLGASLGTVELAIALHYLFESPREPIIWDVGHQAYAHKLITGRWDRFETLRTFGGISGFLSREESEHDVFGAGHSSTSLSASLAMAWARRASQDWTIAVIGDGGLTAGMAFEALNNVRGSPMGPYLIVLNDNQMSISENVGAVSSILSGQQVKEFFSLFGFDYVGPIDGNNLETLLGTIGGIRQGYNGKPVVLHALTQKGKGYIPAEESPWAYHGVSPVQGKVPDGAKAKDEPRKSYSDAFGEALCELAARDPKVVAITAAMPEGTGLSEFARSFPDRFFDVGIAEPHAVTFAAGLATQGYRPIVAIYSTFLQRGIDQIIHDVALQSLGVTFAIDRAGIVGADGPTHHGIFDLAYLGMIPKMTVSTPACQSDLASLMGQAVVSGRPWAIRYPRGTGPQSLAPAPANGLRWHQRAKAEPELIVVALGSAIHRAPALPPEATLVSSLFAKPLPLGMVQYLKEHPAAPVLVIEDGVIHGGFGEAILAELGPRSGKVELAGYADSFIPHGSIPALEELAKVSRAALQERVSRLIVK